MVACDGCAYRCACACFAAHCINCSPTPQPATYQGAAANGSKVFFTTSQQLVNGDTDNTTDLYEYDFANPPTHHLVQLSGGGTGDLTPGVGANVQGVVRTSSDGSHVYFVATGVLTTLPNGRGQVAQAGAHNLYGVDTNSGETRFVGELCSGINESGSVTDMHCASSSDSGLWGVEDLETRLGQVTPDGRYLVFDTYAQLISSGPEADTDEAQDVYRYDFQTGEIDRVSIGEPGFLASNNGNTMGMNATIAALPGTLDGADASIDDWSRAISENGEYIVFSTAERLQEDDINGGTPSSSCLHIVTEDATGCDVYLWHDGHVSMISDGRDGAEHGAGGPVISASGSDVFFFTDTQLVGQDVDVLKDMYDARIDGGFPAPKVAPSCTGEEWTCQGKGSEPPPPPNPEGSATQQAAGNLTAAPFKELLEPEPKSKSKPLPRAQKLALALKTCRKEKSKKRRSCEAQARKRYAPPLRKTTKKR